MGLFDLFRKIKAFLLPQRLGIVSQIGQTEAICPYCNHQINKMPGRKTKCPSCGNHMLVRTRPSDQKKVLIREDQAIEIEEQWSIVNGTHEEFLCNRKQYETTRKRLQEHLGHEPSENEISWAKLNDELPHHAESFQWGLFRNTRLQMGDILKSEGRFQDALNTYLEVCYLDANGPSNTGPDPFVLRLCPAFDPKRGSLAPTVVGYVIEMIQRLELSKGVAEGTFHAIANQCQLALKLPLSPKRAWQKLGREIP